MTARRVTREDVARAAGTSVAVVSYVINDGPRPVSRDTRQRVLDAIDQTGYRPNSIAQALARGATRTYGFVVPNISNPFVGQIAHAVEEQVFAHRCVLLLGDSADDKAREREIIDSFLSRQVDGLIYMGVDHELHLDQVAATRTPVVVFAQPAPDGDIPAVSIDEHAAAVTATTHLVEHGRTRLAIVTGPADMLNAATRLDGFRQALSAAGLPSQDEWTVRAPYTRRGGFDAGRELVRHRERPEAVFASNEQQAIGLLAALADAGLRVPDDVAVVCLNGTAEAEFTTPSLSAVVQPITAMAAAAVSTLASAGDAPAATTTYDHELVRRRSCGCTYQR